MQKSEVLTVLRGQAEESKKHGVPDYTGLLEELAENIATILAQRSEKIVIRERYSEHPDYEAVQALVRNTIEPTFEGHGGCSRAHHLQVTVISWAVAVIHRALNN